KRTDPLGDRDTLLYWSLRAGIARRQSDFVAMREAWLAVRAQTFGMTITLFDLLPLGELLVVAARLHDRDRTQRLLEQALALLERLGEPPVWATPLHWQGVQAAFQAENPEALLPHAKALVRAGKNSSYAAILAQAGETWLKVLRRETDFESVEASVRALAES